MLRVAKSKLIVLLATLLFFGAVFLIAYTGRGDKYFDFLKYIPGGDKTGHLVLLAALSFIISWLLSFRGARFKKVKVHYGILLVAAFITIEEFVQIFSPYRTSDVLDLLCNYLGILIAFLGISFHERRKVGQPDTGGDAPPSQFGQQPGLSSSRFRLDQ